MPPIRPIGSRRRRRLALLLGLGALIVLAVVAAPAVGLFLVVADPLEPSDAIIVLDGRMPAREVEAAALYHRGLAPRIVLARGRDPIERAQRVAGEPPHQERAAAVLVRLGVPAAAIVKLERVVENTLDELAEDFEYCRRMGLRRVILVTSPAHTRRVRLMWRSRYGAQVTGLVHPTPYEEFDPARWWRSRRTIEVTVHEIFGIAHFMVGSPVPTFDRTR